MSALTQGDVAREVAEQERAEARVWKALSDLFPLLPDTVREALRAYWHQQGRVSMAKEMAAARRRPKRTP